MFFLNDNGMKWTGTETTMTKKKPKCLAMVLNSAELLNRLFSCHKRSAYWHQLIAIVKPCYIQCCLLTCTVFKAIFPFLSFLFWCIVERKKIKQWTFIWKGKKCDSLSFGIYIISQQFQLSVKVHNNKILQEINSIFCHLRF